MVMVCADSTEEVRSGGSANWRANNPGNLESGEFSAANGQIGSLHVPHHVDAVFPDMLTGWNALVSRLGTDGYGVDYPDKTLDQAMNVFAPPFQNNTAAYIAFLHTLTGLSGSERLGDVSASQLSGLASAIFRYEGAKVGTVTYRPWQ